MTDVSTQNIDIVRFEDLRFGEATDFVAVEEPLEIQLSYTDGGQRILKSISVTMRTPGNDAELAAGFFYTEGILPILPQAAQGGLSIAHTADNRISVSLPDGIDVSLNKTDRNFYTTSSCGVCGKASIDAVRTGINTIASEEWTLSAALLTRLPELLRTQQAVFETTGGLHASALFDPSGNLILLREDVGRHNALDKLIGYFYLKHQLPLPHSVLLLSGRASFELIQKAAAAGIKIVAAVGAPSSLALSLAKDCNMTLAGFLRGNRFNIYCGKERVVL